MSILTLELAQVKIGSKEVEGLLDINTGNFYVAVSQTVTQFSIPIKHASRDIKAMIGAGFSFPIAKTKLHSKPVNVLNLGEYELVAFNLVLKGNLEAIEFCKSLIGLSLTQLFSDAFGIKFEIEEKQEYLLKRQAQKEIRLKETGCVDSWMVRHDSEISLNYKKWIWVNISDAVNLALTGQKASYWRKQLGLKDDCLLRDNWNLKMLSDI